MKKFLIEETAQKQFVLLQLELEEDEKFPSFSVQVPKDVGKKIIEMQTQLDLVRPLIVKLASICV